MRKDRSSFKAKILLNMLTEDIWTIRHWIFLLVASWQLTTPIHEASIEASTIFPGLVRASFFESQLLNPLMRDRASAEEEAIACRACTRTWSTSNTVFYGS